MRGKNVLRNSIYSVGAYLFLAAVGFLTRKVFIEYLGVELLGCEGLFSSIFTLLSLAELGVNSVITYGLYQEIAAGNQREIAKLMMMYKWIYRAIGSLVLIIGILLLPLLPILIKETSLDISYLRLVYCLQLFSTICTYFLSYRRALLIAQQCEYLCVRIDALTKVFMGALQILIIVVYKSYFLYLFCLIIGNISANAAIAKICNIKFPYAKKIEITQSDFKRRNFYTDIKNFLVHKLSFIVYSGTDNIVISVLLGLKQVAFYSNYVLLNSQVNNILTRLTQPLQAGIGNLVYSDPKERGKKVFQMIDLGFFLLSVPVACFYFFVFQALVKVWLGEQYLLSNQFMAVYAMNIFVSWQFAGVTYFRNAFGGYEIDKKYMMQAAVVNLTFSVILGHFAGLAGVVFATISGNLFIIYGRVFFLHRMYFEESELEYLKKHMIWFLAAAFEFCLTLLSVKKLPDTIVGIGLRCILCMGVPTCINCILFFRSQSFRDAWTYLRKLIKRADER